VSVTVAITRDYVFDSVGDFVGERRRALLDLVRTSIGSVTEVICTFAHVLGD
jgi:hypothetical protein